MNMRKVPVDMLMLPTAFESHGESRWYLDLETGDVFPVCDDPDEEEKVENDPDRFLVIEALPSARDDFRVMEDFVAGLPEGEAKRDLERVLRRARPFRNFREAVHDWPDVQKQWYAVRDRRVEAAARDWLAENGIEPTPRPPGNGPTVIP